MSDRIDTAFPGGTFTHKLMPNGEARSRIVFDDGLATIVTRMPEWMWEGGVLPWQECHCHKGLTETYTILQGWAIVVEHDRIFDERQSPMYRGLVMSSADNEIVKIYPGESHIVLLGPGAVLQTVLTGMPIGNPDKGGQDWWLGAESMVEWIREQTSSDSIKRAVSNLRVI